MHPREMAISAYKKHFGTDPAFVARAPGRVNLLGEHVDYNDGFVLPAAIDLETYLAFSPAAGDANTIVAADFGEVASYSSYTLREKADVAGKPLKEWAYYPASVAWVLEEAGYAFPTIQGAFSSNIPRGSGLSSSASVLIAFAMAYKQAGNLPVSGMQMAKLGQKAENQYVGVNCGIMDQFASTCGLADQLLLLDCRSLEWKPVPLSDQLAIVVADTSIRRKLTSGEYNNRRESCEAAVRRLRHSYPRINSLRDVSVEQLERSAGELDDLTLMRARHVVYEIERTRKATELLYNNQFAAFGGLMEECHSSLRDLYEVSCPELDLMTRLAKELPGYLGARLTGAGFGGCTVNLVEKAEAQQFARLLGQRYAEASGLQAQIYICHASDGASIERL